MVMTPEQREQLQQALRRSRERLQGYAPQLKSTFDKQDALLAGEGVSGITPTVPAPAPLPAPVAPRPTEPVEPTPALDPEVQEIEAVERQRQIQAGGRNRAAQYMFLRQHALTDPEYQKNHQKRGYLQQAGEYFEDGPLDHGVLDSYKDRLVNQLISDPNSVPLTESAVFAALQIEGQKRHGRLYKNAAQLRTEFAEEEAKQQKATQDAASALKGHSMDARMLVYDTVQKVAHYIPYPSEVTPETQKFIRDIAGANQNTPMGAALSMQLDDDTNAEVNEGMDTPLKIQSFIGFRPPSNNISVFKVRDGPQEAQVAMRRFVTRSPKDGTIAVDGTAYKNAIATSHFMRRAKREGINNVVYLDEEKRQRWHDEAWDYAYRKVERIIAQQSGALTVDIDHNLASKMSEGKTGLAPVLGNLVGTATGEKYRKKAAQAIGLPHVNLIEKRWTDADISLQRAVERGLAPFSALLTPGPNDTTLEWFGRSTLFNVVGSWALDDEVREAGFGSPHHVYKVRMGYDWYSDDAEFTKMVGLVDPVNLLEEGAEAVTGTRPDLVSDKADRIRHTIYGLGLLMVDPDLLSIAMPAVGSVARAGMEIGGIALRGIKAKQGIQAAKLVRNIDGEQAIPKIRQQLKESLGENGNTVFHGYYLEELNGVSPTAGQEAATTSRAKLQEEIIQATKVAGEKSVEIAQKMSDIVKAVEARRIKGTKKVKLAQAQIDDAEAVLSEMAGTKVKLPEGNVTDLLADLANKNSALAKKILRTAENAEEGLALNKLDEYSDALVHEARLNLEAQARKSITISDEAKIRYHANDIVHLATDKVDKAYVITGSTTTKGGTTYKLLERATGTVRKGAVEGSVLRPTPETAKKAMLHAAKLRAQIANQGNPISWRTTKPSKTLPSDRAYQQRAAKKKIQILMKEVNNLLAKGTLAQSVEKTSQLRKKLVDVVAHKKKIAARMAKETGAQAAFTKNKRAAFKKLREARARKVAGEEALSPTATQVKQYVAADETLGDISNKLTDDIAKLEARKGNSEAAARALAKMADGYDRYSAAINRGLDISSHPSVRVKQLEEVFSDATSPLFKRNFADPRIYALATRQLYGALARSFDPLLTAFGKYSPELHKAQVSFERELLQANGEVIGLVQVNGWLTKTVEYLTTSAPIRIGSVQTTQLNRGVTYWKRFRDAATKTLAEEAQRGALPGIEGLSRAWLSHSVKFADAATKAQAYTKLRKVLLQALDEGKPLQSVMDELQQATSDIIGSLNLASVEEAWVTTISAVQHTAHQQDLLKRVARITGPTIDEGTAWGMTQLLRGPVVGKEGEFAENALNFEKALKGMAQWGMPLLSSNGKTALEKMTTNYKPVQSMLAWGKWAELSGEALYVPDGFIKGINAPAQRFLKEIDKESDITSQFFNNFRRLSGVWQRAVVEGYFLPKVTRPIVTWMGDIFSLFQEQELENSGRTGAIMFESAIGYIPGAGPRIQSWLARSAQKADDLGVPFLGSLLGSVYEPTVDRLLRGLSGSIETTEGVITYQQFMKNAIRDGVSEAPFMGAANDYFEASALSHGLWAAIKSRGGKSKALTRYATDTFNEVQIRQRLSLYTRMQKAGSTRKEAAAAVKNAFYDWDHGVAKWEIHLLSNVLIFPSLWRNLFNQQFRAVMNASAPLQGKTLKDMISETATRSINSPLARARKAVEFSQGIPESFVNHPSDEDTLDDVEAIHAWMNAGVPFWHDTEMHMGTTIPEEYAAEWYEEQTGKKVSRIAWMMPEATQSDPWQAMGMMLSGLNAMAFFTDDDMVFKEEYFDDFVKATVLDRTLPTTEWITAAGYAWATSDETRKPSKKLRPGERLPFRGLDDTLTKMGFTGILNENQTEVRSDIGPAILSILRTLPQVGTVDLPRWIAAIHDNNPHMATGNWDEGLKWMMGQLLLNLKPHGFDPVQEAVSNSNKANAQLRGMVKEEEKSLRLTPRGKISR